MIRCRTYSHTNTHKHTVHVFRYNINDLLSMPGWPLFFSTQVTDADCFTWKNAHIYVYVCLQAITSVHTQCHHWLRSIVNHTPTNICRCMPCFFHASWFGTTLYNVSTFRILNCNTASLLFSDAVFCLEAVFFCLSVSAGLFTLQTSCLLLLSPLLPHIIFTNCVESSEGVGGGE